MKAKRLGILPDALGTGVAKQLQPQIEAAFGSPVEIVPIEDANFTPTENRVEPLRQALRDGRADIVIHRVTNLPTEPPADITAVTPPRANPRDALCSPAGHTLNDLPRGARVGSDEPRRSAQLRSMRPDLNVIEVGGDAIAQLEQANSDLDAVVLSIAVLDWLDRTTNVTDVLEPNIIAPAPGQGALAVEARPADLDSDPEFAAALEKLDDLPTRLAVIAERTVIAKLEAEKKHPMGTWGRVVGEELLLGVAVSDLAGSRVVRHRTVAKLPPGWREAGQPGAHVSQGELENIAVRLGNRVAGRINI